MRGPTPRKGKDERQPKRPLRGLITEAIYQEAALEEFQGNPYITALADRLEPEEFRATVRSEVHRVSPEQLQAMRTGDQLDAVYRVRSFFEPFDIHVRLDDALTRTLKWSYVGRNPLDPLFNQSLNRPLILKSNSRFKPPPSAPTVNGFSILGVAGSGKTKAVEQILGTWPQLIKHKRFAGKRFVRNQLVWLKIDCPRDGSVHALCTSFFNALDDTLQAEKHYFRTYAQGRTVNEMIENMGQVASLLAIGVLVIDEIQHVLNDRKDRAKDEELPSGLLNTLVTLVNNVQMPVILIGTYKAFNVLSREFREARRGEGQGDFIWERLPLDSPDWDAFVKRLWKLQYVKTPTPLNPDLSGTLWNISRGIVDIACKVYMLAQIRAIMSGNILITEGLLYSTAHDSMNLTRRSLDMLREYDNSLANSQVGSAAYDELHAKGDLIMPRFDDEDFDTWMDRARTALAVIEQLETQREPENGNRKLEVLTLLEAAGVPDDIAHSALAKVLTVQGQSMKFEELRDATITTAQNLVAQKSLSGTAQERKQRNNVLLIDIVTSGQREGKTPYSSLVEGNFMRNLSSYAENLP